MPGPAAWRPTRAGKQTAAPLSGVPVPYRGRVLGSQEAVQTSMKDDYLESVSLIERLHRQFLEVVKLELDNAGIRDINNVQALILFHIGGDEPTVGELTQRGYYLGTNVTYNLKKLIENKYVSQSPSKHDRRSVHVKLTPSGLKVQKMLDRAFDGHAAELARTKLKPKDLMALQQTLRSMEQFWVATIAAGGYAPPG